MSRSLSGGFDPQAMGLSSHMKRVLDFGCLAQGSGFLQGGLRISHQTSIGPDSIVFAVRIRSRYPPSVWGGQNVHSPPSAGAIPASDGVQLSFLLSLYLSIDLSIYLFIYLSLSLWWVRPASDGVELER